ncbi:GHKL domain-containing protein [Sulfurovum sp. bin170]|uniref:ATP-binding protein n=1 Tax=Sulfurovum sp. bin170 TaxID=2695268 RepID=UPI0013E043D8|nr:ATP-binding protein [Sulfurovum sp. bin170]NEW59701.1 GHKL domain-containing protein [Sulfurovum sp. bin170]
MRQLVHYYRDFDSFTEWCDENSITNSERLLIEINYPNDDRKLLKILLTDLQSSFADATIVGMQSFASFTNHQVSDLNRDPIISIMEFDTSSISSMVLNLDKNYIKGECNDYKAEKHIIEKYLQADTEAVEILSSFNDCHTSSFINSLGEDFRHLKIFGGGSTGKSHNTNKSFVFHNNKIYDKAIILIFMHGENLTVELYQAFDWKPISKKKRITKTDDSTIFTMGDSPALDIYRKYFPNLDSDTSVFLQVPLYITKGNSSYTVHILNADLSNQSISTAQPLEENDIVQLSIGNYNAMMNRTQEIYNFLTKTPAQALWIGACISYEYGFRIPIKYYISNIKSNNHIFGYTTSQEYFNEENHPNTFHNHTFIMAAITESNNSYIELEEYKDENITPFEIANKNLYSIMHKTANELNRLTENLEIRVNQRTQELKTLNDELQIRIDDAVREVKRQTAIMNQQSRLASMGEILENIAHQWRQPLNAVSWVLQDIEIKAKLGNQAEIDIEAVAEKINNSIQFLSNTIEDFRRFVDKSDMAQTFNLKKTIESTKKLIDDTLTELNIKIELDCDEDINYKGFENDIKHVIMNLINNARDAFEENEIKNGIISIRVYHEKDELIIAVKDNAGGIPKKILKSIFEPYYTTKHKTKGTGLGLYMSKNLIEKVKGSLEVASILNGKTTFIITLPDEGAMPKKK